MRIRLSHFLFIIFLAGCNDDSPPAISLLAESFLREVINTMERYSINKNTIDWTDFREKVFAKAGTAQTIGQTYPAITEALKMLGDNHSVLIKPDGGSVAYHTISCTTQTIIKPDVPGNIGYVKVNHFGGSSEGSDAVAFAREIQNQIKVQDDASIIGWIVDLRGNLGGNMWPMVAGIGPILGEGTAGYFLMSDGLEQPWGYEDGASIVPGEVVTQVPDFYELISPNPKVAVLLDNGVASSGEVVAISFIGRDNTQSFGSPTCGLSTANAQYKLSNGHVLALTVGYLADRNKNKFGIPVPPDVTSTNATIIQDAIEWIQN